MGHTNNLSCCEHPARAESRVVIELPCRVGQVGGSKAYDLQSLNIDSESAAYVGGEDGAPRPGLDCLELEGDARFYKALGEGGVVEKR